MPEASLHSGVVSNAADSRAWKLRWPVIGRLKLVRRAVLGMPADAGRLTDEAGFNPAGPAASNVDLVIQTFLSNYNMAVEQGLNENLFDHLRMVDPALRGFAYEAAAMGLHVLDSVFPFARGHCRGLLERVPAQAPLIFIGVGFGVGAFRLSCTKAFKQHTHWTRPLIADGYGFQQVMFNMHQVVHRQRVPSEVAKDDTLSEHFTAGVGRAVWFAMCGDPDRTEAMFADFPNERRSALWRGVGFAATYAGGVDEPMLTRLVRAAGESAGGLAQGAALACYVRHQGQNPTPHTEVAARVLSRCDSRRLHDAIEAAAAESFGRDARVPAGGDWRSYWQVVAKHIALGLSTDITTEVVRHA